MTRPEIPLEIRSLLTDDEISEIDERAIEFAHGRRDAIRLAIAWNAHVEKIDEDRALPWSDHSVWNEHDLAAAMFMRDFVEDALDPLSSSLRAKLRSYVDAVDEVFRSYTIDDSGERMAGIATVDVTDRGWWWFRVPASGPVAQDIAGYEAYRRLIAVEATAFVAALCLKISEPLPLMQENLERRDQPLARLVLVDVARWVTDKFHSDPEDKFLRAVVDFLEQEFAIGGSNARELIRTSFLREDVPPDIRRLFDDQG